MTMLICVLVWAAILYFVVWSLVRLNKWHDQWHHRQMAKIPGTTEWWTKQKESR